MLKQATDGALAFDAIVVKQMSGLLTAQGFQVEPPLPPDTNNFLLFTRKRHGQVERVGFCRRIYREEDMSKCELNDVVDYAPDEEEGEDLWASRHFLSVQIITNYSHTNLLTSGRVGTNDEGIWWHFADENDLKRQLRKITKLLLTVGLRSFDDALEDSLGRERVLQENVA